MPRRSRRRQRAGQARPRGEFATAYSPLDRKIPEYDAAADRHCPLALQQLRVRLLATQKRERAEHRSQLDDEARARRSSRQRSAVRSHAAQMRRFEPSSASVPALRRASELPAISPIAPRRTSVPLAWGSPSPSSPSSLPSLAASAEPSAEPSAEREPSTKQPEPEPQPQPEPRPARPFQPYSSLPDLSNNDHDHQTQPTLDAKSLPGPGPGPRPIRDTTADIDMPSMSELTQAPLAIPRRVPAISGQSSDHKAGSEMAVLRHIVAREAVLGTLRDFDLRSMTQTSPGEVLDVLDRLRLSTVLVLETVLDWRTARPMRKRRKRPTPAFIWREHNYVLKMLCDTDWLEQPFMVKFVGHTFLKNPLLVKPFDPVLRFAAAARDKHAPPPTRAADLPERLGGIDVWRLFNAHKAFHEEVWRGELAAFQSRSQLVESVRKAEEHARTTARRFALAAASGGSSDDAPGDGSSVEGPEPPAPPSLRLSLGELLSPTASSLADDHSLDSSLLGGSLTMMSSEEGDTLPSESLRSFDESTSTLLVDTGSQTESLLDDDAPVLGAGAGLDGGGSVMLDGDSLPSELSFTFSVEEGSEGDEGAAPVSTVEPSAESEPEPEPEPEPQPDETKPQPSETEAPSIDIQHSSLQDWPPTTSSSIVFGEEAVELPDWELQRAQDQYPRAIAAADGSQASHASLLVRQFRDLSADEVRRLMLAADLPTAAAAVEEHHATGALLRHATDDDLRELGVRLRLHRRKALREIGMAAERGVLVPPSPAPAQPEPQGETVPLHKLTAQEVAQFLRQLGLPTVAPVLAQQGIDGGMLKAASEQDLAELGVRLQLHRTRLAREVRRAAHRGGVRVVRRPTTTTTAGAEERAGERVRRRNERAAAVLAQGGPIGERSAAQVGLFLRNLGLGRYGSAFELAGIDGRALVRLDDAALQELGVGVRLHRRKIVREVVRQAALEVHHSTYCVRGALQGLLRGLWARIDALERERVLAAAARQEAAAAVGAACRRAAVATGCRRLAARRAVRACLAAAVGAVGARVVKERKQAERERVEAAARAAAEERRKAREAAARLVAERLAAERREAARVVARRCVQRSIREALWPAVEAVLAALEEDSSDDESSASDDDLAPFAPPLPALPTAPVPPPVPPSDEEDEPDVGSILDHRAHADGVEYLLAWGGAAGDSSSLDSEVWVSREQLLQSSPRARTLLQEYEEVNAQELRTLRSSMLQDVLQVGGMVAVQLGARREMAIVADASADGSELRLLFEDAGRPAMWMHVADRRLLVSDNLPAVLE